MLKYYCKILVLTCPNWSNTTTKCEKILYLHAFLGPGSVVLTLTLVVTKFHQNRINIGKYSQIKKYSLGISTLTTANACFVYERWIRSHFAPLHIRVALGQGYPFMTTD